MVLQTISVWCCMFLWGREDCPWHPLGCLCSEQEVLQGNLLGSLLFSLVLVSAITSNGVCADLSWYLDSGALAGPGSAVLRALTIIQALGLVINISKCEMFSHNDINFSHNDLSSFPPAILIWFFWAYSFWR